MLDTDQLAARPFLLQAVHQALLGFRLLASFAQYRGFSEKTCAHQMAALQAIRSDLLKVEGGVCFFPAWSCAFAARCL